MIYNVNLGLTFGEEETPWVPEFNNYGSFITREDINQKIKIPHLDDRDTFNLAKLGDGQILPVNSKWVNNGKNMSPSLISIRKEGVEIDESIVYVTLDKTLKLLKYKAHQQILNTYHSNGDKPYVGCAIVVDNTKNKIDTPIIEIWALQDNGKNPSRYKYIQVFLLDNENSVLTTIDDAPGEEVKDLIKLNKEKKNRRFKINTNRLVTSTYFVDNDKDEKEIEKQTKNMRFINIVNLKGKSDDEIKSICKKELLDKKVKCFTLVNKADIPYELWNENRVLFVFRYDTAKKKQGCFKSN